MRDKVRSFKNGRAHKFAVYAVASSLLMLPLSSCSTGRIEQPAQQVVTVYDQTLITKTLTELTNVEIDSYHAYAKISKEIKNKEFKKFCERLQAEHEDRIIALSKILVDMSILPPLFTKEFKGFTTPGYTLTQGIKNRHRAFEALYTNEIINNRIYDKALEVDMPANIKEVISRNAVREKLLLDEVAGKLTELKRD